MTTLTYEGTGSDVLRRAQASLEASRAQRTPLLLPYLSASFFILLIVGACCSEFYSAGVGFHAAFPTKSDGTSLADDLMSLRYPIIFCLLAGDVVLNAITGPMKAALDRWIHRIAIVAILLLLLGVGAFMFSATLLTLGGEAGQGFAGRFVGLALGIASAGMFTLSFVASHTMIGQLLVVLPKIAAGSTERSRIAAGDAVVSEIEARRTRIESLQATIAELEKPDALRRKAANEAGVITGMVTAELHDLCASRAAMGDAEVEPQDDCQVPDLPLAVLQQRYGDLKLYTSEYFFDVIKQKEA
jgi:hypothetical protein